MEPPFPDSDKLRAAAFVDLAELEDLYLVLRDEIDAAMLREAQGGVFHAEVGDAIALAAQLVHQHAELRVRLGVASDGPPGSVEDVARACRSEKPDSRRLDAPDGLLRERPQHRQHDRADARPDTPEQGATTGPLCRTGSEAAK